MPALLQLKGYLGPLDELDELTNEDILKIAEVLRMSRKEVLALIRDAKTMINVSLEKTRKDGSGGEFTLLKFIAEDPVEPLEERFWRQDFRQTLILAQKQGVLSKKELIFLCLHFGINDGGKQALGEIGDSFGVTPQRVAQIIRRAEEKLREYPEMIELREALGKP